MTTLQIEVPRKRRWPLVLLALVLVGGGVTAFLLLRGGGGGGKPGDPRGQKPGGGDGGSGVSAGLEGRPPAPSKPAPWAPAEPRPFDLHADTPYQQVEKGPFGMDKALRFGDMDVPRLREGHYLGQFWVIWVPPAASDSAAYAEKSWAGLEHMLDSSGGALEIATTPEEIKKLSEQNKIAIVPCMEGAHPLGEDAGNLKPWAARGVRYLGLTWNNSNAFADAALDARPPHGGLSAKGQKLVRLAEELGVAVDVSHAAATTFWDVYVAGERPFIASHSDARSLHDHPRNLDDLQLWAIADAGGVVGVNYHAIFLTGSKKASLADVANHAEHLARVMGRDHVALGSDFDGLIYKPSGLKDVTAVPDLFKVLEGRGWTPAELAGLASGNALRVLGDVVAKRKRPHPPTLAPVDVLDTAGEAAGGHAPLLAADRNVLTAWRPPPSAPSTPLELRVANIGQIGGIVVVGHDENLDGARVRELEVALYDAAGTALGSPRRLRLADDPRPQAVEWPHTPEQDAAHGQGTLRIEIISTHPGARGAAGLAEVAPMRRAAD